MSDMLFIKVNKKRGLELKNAEQDISDIIVNVKVYVEFNLNIVKKILERINFEDMMQKFDRDISGEGDGYFYTVPFNKDDFSFVENASKNITRGFLTISLSLSLVVSDEFNEDHDLYISIINLVTTTILKCRACIEKNINEIVSNITKIKREKFTRDIDYAIYVLKNVETHLLKSRKVIANLFVQG